MRISLGGVRDEADIRGHRKTYIGAMPGRIIYALTQAGVKNPLILLDEIDKMSRDGHGDPTSAMLEVLDGEQNKAFRDHFVELPFDLSDCMFIATANNLENIPRPLADRMEIIELGIYTRREKLEIAKRHLIPKQLTRHNLSRRTLKFTDAAVLEIIDYYTREAGVRSLERTVAKICRKAVPGTALRAGKEAHHGGCTGRQSLSRCAQAPAGYGGGYGRGRLCERACIHRAGRDRAAGRGRGSGRNRQDRDHRGRSAT